MKNAEMKLRLLAKENIKLDEALNFLEMYLEIHGCNSRDTILRIRPLCYATAVETKGLNPLLWGSILQENSSSNAQGASRVTSDSKTDSSSKCVIYKFNGSNPDSAQIFTILSIIVELSEKSAEQVEADEAQNSEVGKEAGQKVRDRTRQKKFCVKSEAAKEPMARYDDITWQSSRAKPHHNNAMSAVRPQQKQPMGNTNQTEASPWNRMKVIRICADQIVSGSPLPNPVD
ncbi:hypothetical protein T4C_4623 [Trichinella pseudospiralis]|uniref:Uncharacterized protein n=1 Tax=Trichinella pseudospiralis TaxID=6337 RepID=A0A0V1JSR6_TRIPS|nr:hypothetical protein T4C_4623 [Trichinella pseudospiralis]